MWQIASNSKQILHMQVLEHKACALVQPSTRLNNHWRHKKVAHRLLVKQWILRHVHTHIHRERDYRICLHVCNKEMLVLPVQSGPTKLRLIC
jgi:hypothetical protein